LKAFDFNGEEYAKASTHQKEWGAKLIDELKIKESDRILDLGCGDGLLSKMIADRVLKGSVLGIDASSGMIGKAKEYETSNCRFQVMDINEIGFLDEFDIIISNATLHWIKDHNKLLANCNKALVKGGMMRFNFAGRGNCETFNTIARELMSLPKYKKYFGSFEWPWYMPDAHSYKKLFEGKSYSHTSVWDENADRYFKDEEEMIRWIRVPSLIPFLGVIDDETDKSGFANDMIELMIKKTKQPDGRCFEYFRRINVFAIKGL
jgi:trans-aconitate 2-methyltransferase